MKANALVVISISFLTLTLSVACASEPPTPLPPSLTLQSTAAPPSTYTPFPTYTLYPTYTPFPQATPKATQAPISSRAPTEPASKRYVSAFGIDYGQAEKYLAQGEQTHLSDQSVVDSLRRADQSIAQLGEVYFWIQRGFKPWSAGGKTIGTVTTDQLLSDRLLGGCHDWALVYASIARELGYPAVMVDTLSITWAKQFQSNLKVAYVGHVFVEVFVGGKWVLVDSTNNWYAADNYDPTNPVIPLKGKIAGSSDENAGFFVMRKGVDTWSYGIRSNNELTRLMEETARPLKFEGLQYPPYDFGRFN